MTAAATSPRKTLLVLDGHSLTYRAFFALPPESMVTASGQVTNAVFGFASMLVNPVSYTHLRAHET